MSPVSDVVPLLSGSLRIAGCLLILPLGWDLIGVAQRFIYAGALAPVLVGAPGGAASLDRLALEFIAGLLIGLPTALAVDCAGSAGELFDTLRGQTISSFYDPLHQENGAALSALARNAFWAMLLNTGFGILLIQLLRESFLLMPAAAPTAISVPSLIRLIVLMLGISFKGCLPFAFACLIIEVCLSAASKQISSASFRDEGFLIKFLIASLLIMAVLQPDFAPGCMTFLSRACRELISLR